MTAARPLVLAVVLVTGLSCWPHEEPNTLDVTFWVRDSDRSLADAFPGLSFEVSGAFSYSLSADSMQGTVFSTDEFVVPSSGRLSAVLQIVEHDRVFGHATVSWSLQGSSKWRLIFYRFFTPRSDFTEEPCLPSFAWGCHQDWSFPVYGDPDDPRRETGFLLVVLKRLDTGWECGGCVL